jgi:murein DD-endopeptidase MepM/ murein hydrolase activator NlpD
MKKILFFIVIWSFATYSCATCGPFYVGTPYGEPVGYGEGLHPGIDFDISIGTPIIAISDGKVIYVGELDSQEEYGGGVFVGVSHGKHFNSLYGHMTEVLVKEGESLKRGQLIGLSGASNNGSAHLHFGICKKGGDWKNYSETFDPKMFWLGGQPQCFNLGMDYTNYSQNEITIPVACGDYGKKLISEIKKKDQK